MEAIEYLQSIDRTEICGNFWFNTWQAIDVLRMKHSSRVENYIRYLWSAEIFFFFFFVKRSEKFMIIWNGVDKNRAILDSRWITLRVFVCEENFILQLFLNVMILKKNYEILATIKFIKKFIKYSKIKTIQNSSLQYALKLFIIAKDTGIFLYYSNIFQYSYKIIIDVISNQSNYCNVKRRVEISKENFQDSYIFVRYFINIVLSVWKRIISL